jgi:cytochrome d ubiquinol oxidase subunit I
MNHWEVKIPYVMGIIGTRSTTREIQGINQIVAKNRVRILNGQQAVIALEALRKDPENPQLRAAFQVHVADLGFGLLLKKYVTDVRQATPAIIDQAAWSTIPRVAPMFWSFRIMAGLGFSFLLLFSLALLYSLKNTFAKKTWLLRWALVWIPMPWIAAELGWVVAEYGRQPWTIYGMLPTHLSASTLSVGSVIGSIAGFVLFYTGLLIAEMYLMVKYAKIGPSSLGTGNYQFETGKTEDDTVPTGEAQ